MTVLSRDIREFDNLIELLADLEREGITGIERRKHMGSFLMRKSRLHGRPYCGSFELTPLCNFDCRMCYVHLTKEQMNNNGNILSTEQWLDIARQSVDAGLTSVDLTGGECLTHPGFKEIYLYLISRGVNVSVLTNGQLINDDLIDMFVKYPPSSVQISLYGSNREAYINVTRKDAFQDVMDSIVKLRDAGVRLRLSVTPHRFMQDDAAGMLELLHSLNINYSIGTTTLPARNDTGRVIDDYIIDNEAYIEICKLESAYRTRVEAEYDLKPERPYYFRIKGQDTFEGVPCAAGAANFHINWKGEMMPCIAFSGVAKSVLDCGVEEAWVWIRETMKQYRKPIECLDCEFNDICTGCSAEKSSGMLNGPVNPWVCKRMSAVTVPQAVAEDQSDCSC